MNALKYASWSEGLERLLGCRANPALNDRAEMNRRRFLGAFTIMMLGLLAFIPLLNGPRQGDVPVYQNVVNDLLAGKMPYRDRVLEYPPYAVLVFLLPRLFGGELYAIQFVVLAFLADAIMKVMLYAAGESESEPKARSLLPLFLYTLAVPFTQFFYFQRYDIWPALICLAAVWLFASERFVLSGLVTALGIGVKLYPAVFVPPLFILAARRGKGTRYAAGVVAGLSPIALASFGLPWWRFAAFQSDRGIQVESLYASVLWLAKLLGGIQLNWVWPTNKNWVEVQGPSATALLPWARWLFVLMTAGSAAVASWASARCERLSLARLGRLLLVPLVAFVAFNQVLSPQYMIWLLPLAAVACLEGNLWPILIVPAATLLTPVFYPSPEYDTGLSLFQTSVLLARNLLLLLAWAWLTWECVAVLRDQSPKTASGLAVPAAKRK